MRDANGGVDTATATITVQGENDAPVLDNTGNMTLTTITEDQTTNAGQTVASIIASAVAIVSLMLTPVPSKGLRSLPQPMATGYGSTQPMVDRVGQM